MDNLAACEMHKETKESRRYPNDFYFVEMLVRGDGKAWDLFYKEYRKNVEQYIEAKYPKVCGVMEI